MLDESKLRPLLTTREVSELLHAHANTVRRWSRDGLIKSYRITERGDRRYRREDVFSLLARTSVPTSKATVNLLRG